MPVTVPVSPPEGHPFSSYQKCVNEGAGPHTDVYSLARTSGAYFAPDDEPAAENKVEISSSPRPRTGGQLIVECLRAHAVDRVFCVPGESYLEVLDALHDVPEIELVVAKHEGGAANMAEADGKLTGRPGICMVTRGPGATHASIGVHIAQQDSTPMILFIGQVARNHKGREAFQEVDYQAMFGPLAKWVVEIDEVERIPEIMARAFHTAVSGRPGPVVVSLPEDMLVDTSDVPVCAATPVDAVGMTSDTGTRVIEALQQAERPLLIVGGPNWSEQATEHLKVFAERWKLPVACAFRRQDVLDNRHPNYVGHLSLGMNAALAKRVREADLLIALGTRLGDIATDSYSLLTPPRISQKLIHIHADVGELGRVYQADIAIPAPVESVLSALVAHAPARPPVWSDWCAEARRDLDGFREMRGMQCPGAQWVDMTAVVKHLNDILPEDAILSNGAGNYSVWLHRFYEYRRPRTQLAPTCGAMGYGVPAAVAASLRQPGKTVVAFAGDGCFLMYPQELVTAVEYGAKFVVLVVNNGMYGTIRMHQERHHPGRVSGTRLKGPDFSALAKACGAYAEKVVCSADFPAAFARALESGTVALLELQVDPAQITPAQRLS